MKHLKILVALIGLGLLAGCATFKETDVSSFVDDAGFLIRVRYGERSRPHTYEIVSPTNGKSLACESKMMVKIVLPNGEKATCYYAQNDFSYGTMYKSDDGHWKFFTTGLEAAIFEYIPEKNDYLLVFKGVAAGTPKEGE